MSILAIDPGTEKSAVVHFKNDRVVQAEILPNEALKNVLLMWGKDGGDVLAIEMIQNMGMAVGQEVFETVYWVGRFRQAWGGKCHRIYRKDIKLHLCGSARAKDANVRQALIDKFGGKEKAIGKKKTPGPLHGVKSHAWSALAVAVTYAETHSITPKSMEAQ